MVCKIKTYGAEGSHPPEVITQDPQHRFVTDEQIEQWTEGTAGQGQFMSMVFRRAKTVPATPTGGSFNFPIPDGGLWTNTILPGLDPVFVSSRFFTSDGKLPQQETWQPPVLFVQNGTLGSKGEKGDKGEPGLTIQGPPGNDGADGVDGTDGTSIVWIGESPMHPIDAENGFAYRNTADKKSYVFQDGAWYQMTVDGLDGLSGYSNAIVTLYHASADASNVPESFTGTFTYDFTTTILSGGDLNGWSQSISSIGTNEVVWARQASAASNEQTDTIEATEFSSAIIITGSGADGINSATVTLYHKNTSATVPPTKPTGTFSYSFLTHLLSGGTLNGWAQSAPSIGIGERLWMIQATASSVSKTDYIEHTEFSVPVVIAVSGNNGLDIVWKGALVLPPSNPVKNWVYRDANNNGVYIYNGTAWEIMVLDGSDGIDGASGQGIVKSLAFIRAATAPATPSGGTFSSPNPTTAGWTDGIPSGTNPLYVSKRTFTSDGLAPQEALWSTPVLFAQNGTNGINANGAVTRYKFSTSVTAPATGASNSTYPGTGWSSTAGETTIWMTQQVNTTDHLGAVTAYGNWVTPVKIKGEIGVTGLSVYITYHDADPEGIAPAPPTNAAGTDNGWHTNATAAAGWMSQKVDDGTGVGWGLAIRIRGSNGNSGPRGSSTFTIEESTTGTVYVTPATAVSWAGTLTDTEAQNVARDIILTFAADGTLRPNDRITVTDTSAQVAGTRIYQGAATADYTQILASQFSSLVTEIVDGSLIVDGTVSATALGADIISGGKILGTLLEVTNAQIIGQIRSDGVGSTGLPMWEINKDGTLILRAADGATILQSGGTLSKDFITGLGNLSTLNGFTLENINTYFETAAIGAGLIADAAVGTLKIQENAVTVPVSAFTVSKLTLLTTWQTAQAGTLNSEGQPVFISFTSAFLVKGWTGSANSVFIYLRIIDDLGEVLSEKALVESRFVSSAGDTTTYYLHHVSGCVPFTFRYTPVTGNRTISIQIRTSSRLTTNYETGFGEDPSISSRSLYCAGVKR